MLPWKDTIARSLKLRLVLPMFACLLTAAPGFTVWDYGHRHQRLVEEALQEAAHTSASLREAIVAAADVPGMQRVLSAAASPHQDIGLLLVVAGPRAEILASNDSQLVGLEAAAVGYPDLVESIQAVGQHESVQWGRAGIDYTTSFRFSPAQDHPTESRLGALLLHYDLRRLEQRARDDAVRSAGTMMLLVILFASAAFWTLEKYVLSRLFRLGHAVADFSESRTIHELDFGRDEIGRLSAHILRNQRDFASRERELATIVEASGDGIIFIGSDSTIIQFNRAAEETFGYRAAEMLGENVSILMPPPHAEGHQSYVHRYLETGEKRVIGTMREVQGRHREGRVVPLMLSVVDVPTESGTVFVAVFRDLTEQRRSENHLKAYATALESATMRAESSAEAKAEFLANMSHEIRTPMTAILGYVDLLLDEATPLRERRGYLRTVRQNGEHLLSLINDILDLSKIEADRVELERLECDLVELVGSVIDLLRFRAQDKGIRLVAANDGPVPRHIVTDATRVRQVLVNLVGNAIKFTSLGGVTLRVRWAAGASTLHLDVEDTGIGMDPERLDQIFEAFGQAEASTSRKFGGTGLGLTISRKLARKLGGEIHVSSTPDVGSVFSLSIPVGEDVGAGDLVDDLAAEIASRYDHREFLPAEDSDSSPTSAGRVLLAEDNPVNQKLIERFLQRQGAEVFIVGDGQQACTAAMASLENEPFDIVLMDMIMPIMDGYEATAFLREKGYPGTIVALTANAMEGDRKKCLQVGCDDYLTKPIQHEEFRRVLRLYAQVDVPA